MNALAGHLSYVLYIVCILLSGAAGFAGGAKIARTLPHQGGFLLRTLALLPVVAALTFLVSYGILGLSILSVVERKAGTELPRPSMKWGIICSALMPFALVLFFVIAYIIGATTGSLRDSL
jgi:hypothetical protein